MRSKLTRDRDAALKVLAVEHKLANLAIKQARDCGASITIVSKKILKAPLVVLRIRDRVTSVAGAASVPGLRSIEISYK